MLLIGGVGDVRDVAGVEEGADVALLSCSTAEGRVGTRPSDARGVKEASVASVGWMSVLVIVATVSCGGVRGRGGAGCEWATRSCA